MSGQLTQVGAQILANKIAGNDVPYIGTSAPGSWIPGQPWINDTTNPPVTYSYNGTSWVTGSAGRYVALLTASPFTSGSGGTNAETISDLVELATTGYSRVSVTFSDAAASYPAPVSNSSVLTFGPMGAAMTLAAQWAALVTASTGTTGLLLYYWQLDTPQQVSVSQSIQIPIGDLQLTEA